MNPEIKKRWVEALRSGEYEWGTTRLRVEVKESGEMMYCPLGVLCDLYSKDMSIKWARYYDRHARGGFVFYQIHGSIDFLPPQIVEWAEVEDLDPDLEGRLEEFSTVSEMHDSAHYSPEDIAGFIEAQL